jgi:glycosyltransferase involved in cell wall biosynthesis
MNNSLERLPVTVIIPCYRANQTILRAVNSVAHQTAPPSQIILVDDFSDDDWISIKFLNWLKEHYPEDPIDIIELDKNVGPGSARNAAWDSATQPYIAFLDADDAWHPEKLYLQYSWMINHPEVVMTAHASTQIKEGQVFPKLAGVQQARPINKLSLLLSNYLPTRSVMIKRDIDYRFYPGKRYAEDYLLWLTILLNKHPAYFLKLSMAYSFKNDFGEDGLTGNLNKAHDGVIDTYMKVYRDKKISYFTLTFLLAYSWIKYFRRLIIVGFKKLSSWLGS